MLSIYRRHRPRCKFSDDRASKKCRCAVWCDGTVEGTHIRRSLKTRSWERALSLARKIEDGENVAQKVTLKDAIARYLADCEGRKLADSTIYKSEKLLEALQNFATTENLITLDSIGTAQLRAFRGQWTWGALLQSKQIERLKAFFKFSVQNKWLVESPAQFLKSAKVEPTGKVQVFTKDELDKIHAAISRPIMRAFILTLEHTGLRIGDAVKLQKEDISNGKLCIVTKKTKSVVWLPLPPNLLQALEAIPTTQYYFWTGESKLSTVIGSKRRGIAKLLKRAGVEGNPHKFRHTLATNLLMQGTNPSIVAKILGNSEKVVTKYYDHWVPERYAQLEMELAKTWLPPVLKLVKK